MSNISLTEEQINDFKEIGNIGAGNAASRLSDLIHRRCMIGVPEVLFLDRSGLKKAFDLGNAFAVAISIKIMGDIPAVMLIMIKRICAHKIIQYIIKETKQAGGKNFSFTAQVALKQLGENLTKAFSESIAQFLKGKAKFAMPDIVVDTWSTALDIMLEQIGAAEETQMVVYSSFYDPEKTFEGTYVYVLNQESQEIILNRMTLLLL